MSENWVMALDNLAACGAIDFDAPAFLLGQKPRYVGHPSLGELPMQNPMYFSDGIKMKDVPQKDMYEKSESKDFVHNPTWKKILCAGVVVVGLILARGALLRGKNKLVKGFKNFISKIKMPKIKTPKFLKGTGTKMSNAGKNAIKYIKKGFTSLKSKIHL